MSFKSKAQAAFFNIHKKELQKQGVNVDEWNASSKGKDLPEHVGDHAKPQKQLRHTTRPRQS